MGGRGGDWWVWHLTVDEDMKDCQLHETNAFDHCWRRHCFSRPTRDKDNGRKICCHGWCSAFLVIVFSCYSSFCCLVLWIMAVSGFCCAYIIFMYENLSDTIRGIYL